MYTYIDVHISVGFRSILGFSIYIYICLKVCSYRQAEAHGKGYWYRE